MQELNTDEMNQMFNAHPHAQKPFNVGIQGFKRLLKQNTNLTKAEKNKAVRIYKQRVTERLQEVAQQYKEKA